MTKKRREQGGSKDSEALHFTFCPALSFLLSLTLLTLSLSKGLDKQCMPTDRPTNRTKRALNSKTPIRRIRWTTSIRFARRSGCLHRSVFVRFTVSQRCFSVSFPSSLCLRFYRLSLLVTARNLFSFQAKRGYCPDHIPSSVTWSSHTSH